MLMIMRPIFLLVLALLVILVTGCSSVTLPEKNLYQLTPTVASDNQYSNCHSNKILLVALPQAIMPYNTNKILYQDKPNQLRAFSKNEWVTSPQKMLQPFIAQSLNNTGCFRAVVTEPYVGLSDWTLQTKILSLQQNFLIHPSQVQLVISVDLIDSNKQTLLAQKNWTIVVPSQKANPSAGVLAINRAFAIFLRNLDGFMNDVVKH